MWLKADDKELNAFLEAATVYWQKNLPNNADDAFIIVDAFHQDIRVTLRNLAVANALRRIVPARLVLVTGVDAMWREALWTSFDVRLVRRVGEAYGASDILDLYQLIEAPVAAGTPTSVRVDLSGRSLSAREPIEAEALTEIVDATYCRLAKTPRLPADVAGDSRYQRRNARAQALSAVYQTLFGTGSVVALVTSHVDYDQWGLAVVSARRAGVPVVHTQQTGCMKAYALYPETDTGERTFRGELTQHIGAFFEERVWSRRQQLRPKAELVAWRAKANLGRPSWWRGGASASVDISSPAERAGLRAHVAKRFGFDPGRPIVSVFNHAVSDALGTNHESFPSLGDWFTQTVAFASTATDAQWLFLDHPSQALYDRTGFFASVEKQYRRHRHLAFRPSAKISKNALWSLTDLGVTVRGSVSNELPAYGIPVVQAGWSEWSACGLSTVVNDPEGYWKTLDRMVSAIGRGEDVVSAEQVQRARLWLWFYRSATDVVTPQVPQWEIWPAPILLHTLQNTFRYIESDADPLYQAVERMWTRREPVLTRTDMRVPAASPAAPELAPVGVS